MKQREYIFHQDEIFFFHTYSTLEHRLTQGRHKQSLLNKVFYLNIGSFVCNSNTGFSVHSLVQQVFEEFYYNTDCILTAVLRI